MTYARRGTAFGAALAGLVAVAMLSVQGCDAGTTAQATPRAALNRPGPPAAAHAVTFAEARSVYQAYVATSDSAAQQGDSATGLSDVADAQWEIVHGQYTALDSAGTPVPRYQYGTPDFYVPSQSGYPRWFMVSVPRLRLGVARASAVTTVMVFGRSKAGASWALDGTTELAAGQQLPAISRASDGYAVAMDTRDTSLLLPPDVVGATQAAIVDDGPASPADSVVAAGDYTTGMYAQQSASGHAATAKGLDYLWYMIGASFPPFALRTVDGGALVLYGMYLNTTTEHPKTVSGTPIPVPANFTPLLADPTAIAYRAVYANWTFQYVAIDPASTAHNAKLQVIAGTGAPTYASAN